ncbi:hypothetical protein EXN66_Car007491 [Channa argus]|uniref:Uncharacterized protein n=1 Tax=Channa argus TaxID=215402 RepID=A0A6G1PP91_CHAAH|nr:hypothetical protein EXN66_Car007491 [Channa argus]
MSRRGANDLSQHLSVIACLIVAAVKFSDQDFMLVVIQQLSGLPSFCGQSPLESVWIVCSSLISSLFI